MRLVFHQFFYFTTYFSFFFFTRDVIIQLVVFSRRSCVTLPAMSEVTMLVVQYFAFHHTKINHWFLPSRNYNFFLLMFFFLIQTIYNFCFLNISLVSLEIVLHSAIFISVAVVFTVQLILWRTYLFCLSYSYKLRHVNVTQNQQQTVEKPKSTMIVVSVRFSTKYVPC